MGLLPEDIEEDEELENDIEEQEEVQEEPTEYEIDFKTGQLTGNIVKGLEAIKTWIYLALRVTRYKHTIFSWAYGNEIDAIIGCGYERDLLESEIERVVTECLLENEYITDVDSFEFEFSGSRLAASFNVHTLYGDLEESIEEEYAA